jgi:hypothetical protein
MFCTLIKHTTSLPFIVMTFLVRECYGSPKKHENLLKFVKIRTEECFDKVLNEEFKKKFNVQNEECHY